MGFVLSAGGEKNPPQSPSPSFLFAPRLGAFGVLARRPLSYFGFASAPVVARFGLPPAGAPITLESYAAARGGAD
jgi:hypothetical protein